MGMASVLNPVFVIVHAYMFADKYVNPPGEIFSFASDYKLIN